MPSQKRKKLPDFTCKSGSAYFPAIPLFLFLMIMALFYYIVLIPKPFIIGSDFTAYLTGAQMIKEGRGAILYDLKSQLETQQGVIGSVWPYEKGLLPFRYLPFVGIFFLPFTFLNLIQAYQLFAAINLVLLLLFILLAAKFFKNINQHKIWLLAPLLYIPVFHTIGLGQTSLILTLSLLLIYQSIKSKKPFTAGTLCNLLLFKPQYLTIFPFLFLLTSNKRRFAAGFLSSFATLILLSLQISGLTVLLKYPTTVLATESLDFGSRTSHMFSFNSLLTSSTFGLSTSQCLVINGLFYLAALTLFAKRYQKISFDQAFAAATLFSLLFAFHVLSQDLVLLLVPAFLMANQSLAKKDNKTIIVLVLTLILVSAMSATLKGGGITVIFLLFLATILLFYFRTANITGFTRG